MKQKSLKKNTVYYMIYNVLNIVFPLITGIYIARVLLASEIGEVQYARNIAQYFVILAFLGLPTYGMREISKVRDNKIALNKLFSELFIINFISTVVFLSLYIILIFSVPAFRSDLKLYLITGLAIALNAFNISWLYSGLEEFRYISIRNFVFKCLVFLSLIFFVRNEGDYLIYAGITIFGVAGNDLINVIHARKIVKFDISDLNLKRHLRPVFFLVVVNLAIEIYSLVDVTMLGAMCPKQIVTFYSYGHRIQKILLQVINSVTMVVVPRMSYYYKNEKYTEFNEIISKAFSTILIMSLPMVVGIYFVGKLIITFFYGITYLASAEVLIVLSLLLIISPIGYLLGSRVLLSVGKEKHMVFCVSIGAIVNVFGNYALIPRFFEEGAAWASVISEIVIAIIYIFLGKKYFTIINLKKSVSRPMLSVFVMGGFLYIVAYYFEVSDLIKILVSIVGSVIIYFSVLLLMKEPIVVSTYRNFWNKIKKVL